jgi:hypothetical protein
MIGGAGRLFDFGGITLRMIFFIIALFIQFIYLSKINFKINKSILYFLVSFIFLIILGTLMGYLENGNQEFITENILMFSFFLILPLFTIFIKRIKDVKIVINIFKASSILIALIYLFVIGLSFLNIISISDIYTKIDNPEISFRGENAMFFKGFIYMCCGIFFYFNYGVFSKFIALVIILPAIIASFTRGFLVSIIGTYLIYFAFKKKWYAIFILIISLLSFNFIKDFYDSTLGDRSDSDEVRYIQIKQVLDRTDFVSTFVGHGFGAGVPIRDNHFEINYLEIFYKEGIIGLFFWLSLLVYIIYLFYLCYIYGNEKLASPFLLSTIFLYLQSAANPFLSNSMGITIIFLSITSMQVLSSNSALND